MNIWVILIHPSVRDPAASIFSPGFLEKYVTESVDFPPGFPCLSCRLVCILQANPNYISWVGKSRTGEATNWPGKIKRFTTYRGG